MESMQEEKEREEEKSNVLVVPGRSTWAKATSMGVEGGDREAPGPEAKPMEWRRGGRSHMHEVGHIWVDQGKSRTTARQKK